MQFLFCQGGGKGQVWEGGVRVPGIFWWPGKIKGGTVNPLVASQMDLGGKFT